MKAEIHPKNYRFVVFRDTSIDYSFLTQSTVDTKDTVVWEDGQTYPLVKVEISNKSHPFYTGKVKLVDTAGRIDKFKNRYAKKEEVKKVEASPNPTNAAATAPAKAAATGPAKAAPTGPAKAAPTGPAKAAPTGPAKGIKPATK